MYQDELRDEAVDEELVMSQQLKLMTIQPEFVMPSTPDNANMSSCDCKHAKHHQLMQVNEPQTTPVQR